MSAPDNLSQQQFMWHVSPSANRESIAKRGLRPPNREAVWGFTDRDRARGDDRNDVWRVNITAQRHMGRGSDHSDEWYDDEPVAATTARVHPKRLTLEHAAPERSSVNPHEPLGLWAWEKNR